MAASLFVAAECRGVESGVFFEMICKWFVNTDTLELTMFIGYKLRFLEEKSYGTDGAPKMEC